jgi:glc operon protein GlcG
MARNPQQRRPARKTSAGTRAATPPALRYGAPLALETARRVMAAAEAEAARNGWRVAIAIVDSSGHLVMLHRLDQAQYGALALAQAKAETAVAFRRTTRTLEDAVTGGERGLRMLTAPGVIAIEGGLPLLVGEEVVGAIGVSGVRSEQDVQVAEAGAAALH